MNAVKEAGIGIRVLRDGKMAFGSTNDLSKKAVGDMVGDDLELFPSAGRCGKMQSAPVGMGMPTIRVRNILVGGKGEAWTDIEGGSK